MHAFIMHLSFSPSLSPSLPPSPLSTSLSLSLSLKQIVTRYGAVPRWRLYTGDGHQNLQSVWRGRPTSVSFSHGAPVSIAMRKTSDPHICSGIMIQFLLHVYTIPWLLCCKRTRADIMYQIYFSYPVKKKKSPSWGSIALIALSLSSIYHGCSPDCRRCSFWARLPCLDLSAHEDAPANSGSSLLSLLCDVWSHWTTHLHCKEFVYVSVCVCVCQI